MKTFWGVLFGQRATVPHWSFWATRSAERIVSWSFMLHNIPCCVLLVYNISCLCTACLLRDFHTCAACVTTCQCCVLLVYCVTFIVFLMVGSLRDPWDLPSKRRGTLATSQVKEAGPLGPPLVKEAGPLGTFFTYADHASWCTRA